jgi:hypothetical protein
MHRIEPVLYLSRVPFVFAEAVIIIRVNDGEFALRQRYPPEGVAIANPPIKKNKESYRPFYPRWNFDSDLDVPAPDLVNGERLLVSGEWSALFQLTNQLMASNEKKVAYLSFPRRRESRLIKISVNLC